MAAVFQFVTGHPLLLLCVWGLVASVAFRLWVELSDSKLAGGVYLLIFFALSYLYWVRTGGRLMGGGPLGAAFGVFILLAGWVLGLVFNAGALYYVAICFLGAIGRTLTSDDQVVVRKTYDRAEGAESRGDYEEAAALYRKEIGADPDDREAHRRLAELLLKLARKQEAVEELRRVMELSEGEEKLCAAAFRLAEVLGEELGREVEAADLYQMIVRDHPASSYARYARARLEGMSGS